MSEIERPQIGSAPAFSSLDPLLQKAIKAIPANQRYVIALSGGLDSMALLYFTLTYLKGQNADVVALHVHHGLSSSADSWADYCRLSCQLLGIEYCVEEVEVTPNGKGLEAAARKARYQVFEAYLSEGGILLQGHHQNDQAETVLMRMLRGSGPEGLAGIPPQRELAAGQLFRPWLDVPRSLLRQQAEQFNLGWIDDESNTDTQYDRNFIRHRILPLLQARWPETLNSLTRVSERAAQAHQQISIWSKTRLDALLSPYYWQDKALMLAALSQYPEHEQRILVRHWLDAQRLEHPPEAVFERIWRELIPAHNSAQPELRWGQNRLRRYQGCLFYLSPSAANEEEIEYCYDLAVFPEDLPQMLTLGHRNLRFDLLPANAAIPDNACLLRLPVQGESVVVRTRTGGESLRLPGSRHSKALKKILQDQHVPPWRRQGLPLIFYGEALASIACGLVAEGFAAVPGQDALMISYC